jgi:ubiquinone/menaquinone biosynthesis C-methylase UbiE
MNDLKSRSEAFGEKYFMDPSSGSAYHVNNYLETALLSRTYYEMAEIIACCFEPKKMLEVGCAAGPTIYHLNTYFGIDALGVDVSAWAVEKRLHKNVSQASADALPFADGEFDLIFSCHALEHLTQDILQKSLSELSRVCVPGGVQFHLLPIMESGPYTDVFGSIVGLRKDMTHNLLFNRQWWLKQWAGHGWNETRVRVAQVYDIHHFEFSDCQLLLSKNELDSETTRRIAQRNFDVARTFFHALTRKPAPGLEVFLNEIRDNWK